MRAKRVALLLHPDSGAPAYSAEVPTLAQPPGPDWPTAAAQLARRVRWDLDNDTELLTLGLAEFCASVARGSVPACDLVLGIDLSETPPDAAHVRSALTKSSARLFITSSKQRRLGSFWAELSSLPMEFWRWGEGDKLRSDVEDLWHRRTAEEAVYAVLLLIDGAVAPLASMRQQKPEPVPESIGRAVGRCADEMAACVAEPRCLQSLACLAQCGLADQSCSYRCIVSYQNTAFTEFTLCALQKHNLLNSQVLRPDTPQAAPAEHFRGSPLTHEVAEQILVGHFAPQLGRRHSWLVVAGSNPAYEQFALQYQLWYKGSGRNTFWYRPTFLVEALDGRKLWRTRDYRVRRSDVPGVWEFSVLDNGIISEEKWHLLGCDDDLTWLVLFYVGAAKKAGLTYRGCLLLTRDGEMPEAAAMEGVAAAVGRAGMELWELEATSNPPLDPSNLPPLIAPETQVPAPLLTPA